MTSTSSTKDQQRGGGNPVLELTPRTRLIIYVFFGLGSILVAYGTGKDLSWLGPTELAAWSSLVALVNGLAAINVRTK